MNAVIHEIRGQVLWITINRPEKRNALNDEVIKGISEGYLEARDNALVRAIVITGAGGKAFCAGGDLQPGGAFTFDTSEPTSEYANLLRLARGSPLPSIARINGTCMAGGIGLLCMTDLAVAVDSAQFGLPEVKLGLFPFQVLSLLKEMIGPRLLREFALLGKPFTAQEARSAGLLNHVVDASQLDSTVDELLNVLLSNSPTAIRRGKYALRQIEAMSFEEAIAFSEGQLALLSGTEDTKEGLASFREKRAPRWTGK